MKPVTITMIMAYEHDRDGGFVGDMFPEIVAIGYDADAARAEAIHSLRYSCQSDHTRPSTIKNGYGRFYGPATAMQLEPGDDDDDVPFEASVFMFNGERFAVSIDWEEDAQSITSEELRAEELHYDDDDDDDEE